MPDELGTRRPVREFSAGFEQLAITGSATALASVPANANKAVMTVENATLRYRDDGTNPDANTGLRAFIGATIILNNRDAILNFRAIRTGNTSSEVNCSYYEVV